MIVVMHLLKFLVLTLLVYPELKCGTSKYVFEHCYLSGSGRATEP